MTEIRLIVDDVKIDVNTEKASNFIDYYLSRTQKVRYISDSLEDKYFLINYEHGVIDEKCEITREEAWTYMVRADFIVEKEGVGHIIVDNIEGYLERVLVYKDKGLIYDENHIKFKDDAKLKSCLIKELKPKGIIKDGLYDYVFKK